MLHKHHSTHLLIGFLAGVVLIGATMGGISAYMGSNVVKDVKAERLEKLSWRVLQRRLRRQKRLQKSERVVRDVSITYPMQANIFGPSLQRHKLDVALNIGSFFYPRLQIEAPIGRIVIGVLSKNKCSTAWQMV